LFRIRSAATIAAATAAIVAVPVAAFASPGNVQASHQPALTSLPLTQVNLASDVPGAAKLTDPDLKNPWGAALSATSPLWVANQGTRTSTVYSLAPGSRTIAKSATVRVTLPDTVLGPAGLVANTSNGFVLTNGSVKAPAAFIWSTLDGHIEAWSPKTNPLKGNATDVVPGDGDAYTGLAIAATPRGEELFAANFAQGGSVEVFNSAFHEVKLPAGAFKDSRLPKGYLPFGIQAIGDRIFVTYDTMDPTTHREGVGAGIGAVDEFTTSGRLVTRIATGGPLNAPWGVAIAPKSWGRAAGALLIGNFGDGHINVIRKDGNGLKFLGHVSGQVVNKSTGKPFAEPGLWALVPGTATTGGTNALWFTAGINSEKDGLLGVLRP
jgi:uncharacterized protein (TIGR03118 family)